MDERQTESAGPGFGSWEAAERDRTREGDDLDEIEILSLGEDEIDLADPPRPSGVAPTETAETAELRERYLRLLADFDNFRKRTERERDEARRYALAEPVRELLPVIDNLDRALAAPVGGGASADDLQRGVEMIRRQLVEVLRGFGVREASALGRPFDPALHEAVARVESDAVSEPTVIEDLARGYFLHDRLLRPALVKVAVPAEAVERVPIEESGG